MPSKLSELNVGDEIVGTLDNGTRNGCTGFIVDIVKDEFGSGEHSHFIHVSGTRKDGGSFTNIRFYPNQLDRVDNDADYRSDLE